MNYEEAIRDLQARQDELIAKYRRQLQRPDLPELVRQDLRQIISEAEAYKRTQTQNWLDLQRAEDGITEAISLSDANRTSFEAMQELLEMPVYTALVFFDMSEESSAHFFEYSKEYLVDKLHNPAQGRVIVSNRLTRFGELICNGERYTYLLTISVRTNLGAQGLREKIRELLQAAPVFETLKYSIS